MAFASSWLKTGTVFPRLVNEAPHRDTGIIVVVPAYNEAGIIRLLDSLASCERPGCHSEVIINVNAPAGAGKESLANNQISLRNIQGWMEKNKDCFFRLFFFDLGQPAIRKWGVGLARKSLMDEALRRYDLLNKPEGVIASLDADCLVDKNYFTALEDDLLLRPERKACSVYFEHPTSGDEFPDKVYRFVAQYELHLRYYQYSLGSTGFPNAFHTVGSSFAVKALPYMKAGGMNRRQAGEDFYFVQKLIPAGGYFNLNSTTVYPSPRPSVRVPFGTGMTISRMMENDDSRYLTYNPQAFADLKELFSRIEEVFGKDERAYAGFYFSLPLSLRTFVGLDEWNARMAEISGNTSGTESFRKRFFQWFNMFRIVKYMNMSHMDLFSKIPVESAAMEILALNGMKHSAGTLSELLDLFREAGRAG